MAIGTVTSLLARLARAYRQQPADVVHVNWLQNALPMCGTRTPALITVLGTDFALLRLTGMKIALRSVLRQRRAILAPNADWMCPALQQAFGDLAEVRVIPFGVDDAWFNLQRTPAADGVNRWLTVTRLTARKLGELFNWGEGIFDAQRQLHLFGPMQEQIDIPHWVYYHGPTNPEALQQDWFPTASGLITLSRHDEGRPQVMLEAMAARLPVLASDQPAHCDMLQHRHTGWIAKDAHSVALGLAWLEQPANGRRVEKAASEYVRANVGTWADCAERYARAYRNLLSPAQ
jgi:glycosyltransferase involved in cell wall biosynthesis